MADSMSVPEWGALEGTLVTTPAAVEPDAGNGSATDTFDTPPIRSRHVYLKPIDPSDYALLQMLETVGDPAPRWRHRGVTPSPDQWAQTLWSGVLVQFMVVGAQGNKPIGRVLIYQPNFQDRYAYFAAMRFETRDRSPLMVFGISVFLRYVFSYWPFDKLYMEVPEYNLDQFASGLGRFFQIEGRLRRHLRMGGRAWDQLILALYRADAAAQSSLDLAEREPESPAPPPAVSWEAFVAEVAAIAQVSEDRVQPDTRVLVDLALDSLALAELGVILVEKYETVSPSDDLETRKWDNVTVRALYNEYLRVTPATPLGDTPSTGAP
jgi:acyl carrier protein